LALIFPKLSFQRISESPELACERKLPAVQGVSRKWAKDDCDAGNEPSDGLPTSWA
jgi:hypothetical protein